MIQVMLMVVVMMLLMGCGDHDEDNARSVSGPGVEIHCRNLLPNQGSVGNTTTTITCADVVDP
jgi:hypothetical protein